MDDAWILSDLEKFDYKALYSEKQLSLDVNSSR